MSKYPGAEGETLNICHGGTAEKSPSKACGLGSGPPESAPCHLLGARLSPSVSLLHECLRASSSPPPQHSRSLLLLAAHFRRGWGGGEEVTFINGEFMCMTASKPELCLDRPWRLSINSSNHQSAKYFPFRAHQLCMRWPAVIYRMGRVRRSAHLHRYRYGGSAAPVPKTDRGELEPQNGEALTFS